MGTLEVIADYFGISVNDIKGKHQGGKIIEARRYAYKYLYENDKLSLAKVAEELNRNEHATVLSGKRYINGLINTRDKKAVKINIELMNMISVDYSIIQLAINMPQY